MPEGDDPKADEPKPERSQESGMNVNMAKAWGVTKDLLTLLVIPAVGWIIKLEVANAERDIRIEQLQEDIVELRAEIKEAQDIDEKVQAQAVKLAVLEGKLDTANGRLDEIRDLLRD
jgi:Tfp pilus assembly protein PilN